jgi:alcohol dehydrogenase (NADP+)
MFSAKGYAAHSAHEPLKAFSFDRREPTPTDVQLEILFCGVCHSDLHIARNEWGFTTYPCVPGHEIVGRVVKRGATLRNLKKGIASRSVAWWTRAGRVRIAEEGEE